MNKQTQNLYSIWFNRLMAVFLFALTVTYASPTLAAVGVSSYGSDSFFYGWGDDGPRYSCSASGDPNHAPRVRWPNGEYTETNVDLSVSAVGGPVKIARSWVRGRWTLNPKWESLDFQKDPLGGEVRVIGRSGVFFLRSGSSDVFINKTRRRAATFIRKKDSGWQWYDRQGNTIDYDTQGRIVRYTKPTGVTVNFVRDSDSKARILDHANNTLYTAEMVDGVIVRIEDRSGDAVTYQWSGAEKEKRLDKVTDASGAIWQYKYDANGQLIERIDPEGQRVTAQYAQSVKAPPTQFSLSREGVKIDPSKGQTTKLWNYWGGGRIGSFADCFGTTSISVQWLHKTREFKVTITDSRGNSKVFRYPAVSGVGVDSSYGRGNQSWYVNDILMGKSSWDGELTEEYTNERGNITTTTYNHDYKPVRIAYADGSAETFEYEKKRGLLTRHSNELGISTQWQYDAKGLITKQIEASGTDAQRISSFEYDQYGQLVKKTLGTQDHSITWQYRYDNFGNAVKVINPQGDVWSFAHNVAGDISSITNPLGHTTAYEYSRSNITKVTSATGKVITVAYNGVGNLSEIVDELGHKSKIAYNAQGKVTSVTNALGQTASYTYNAHGNPTSETTPTGNKTTFEHDKKGRVVKLTDPAGNTVSFEHGKVGTHVSDLFTAMVLPIEGARLEFKYDMRGRQTAVTTKAVEADEVIALTQRTTYDAAGNVVAVTSAGGQTSTLEYDALGRNIKVTDALGNVTSTTYNLLDQPLTVTDANGNVHRFQYNKLGQRTEEVRPEGGKTSYQYDKVGQLVKKIDAEGAVVSYQYDADGNLTQETLAATDSSHSQTISYTYNGAGDLSGYIQKGSNGIIISQADYTLDELGRITEETITYGVGAAAITKTIARSFDADWNTSSFTYPNGATSNYQYDRGLLKNVGIPNGSAINIQSYDWMLPRTIEYPGATRTQSYDGLLHFKSTEVKNKADQNLLQLAYQHNIDGSITHRSLQLGDATTGISASTDYRYDALDRLIQATPSQSLKDRDIPTEIYSYDPVGNRTSSAHQPGEWKYETGNRLSQRGFNDQQVSYTYTKTGHVKTETKGSTTRTYHYDGAERLVKLSEGAQTIASYQYDPAGRRISKTTGEGANQKTIWYLYNEQGLIAELDASGQESKTYGWQPDTDWGTAPLWQADHSHPPKTSSYHYLHTDHLQTPWAASNAEGDITWWALSESYGQTHVGAGSQTQINLRFPGQYWDVETGTHYNQQRDYDPITGRYMQSDPLGLHDGVNTYAYGYSNPLSFADPSGEAVFVPVVVYLKCIAECKATDALLEAIQGECDPRTMGDCAKECLNPLNWARVPGAKAVKKLRKAKQPYAQSAKQGADLKEHLRQIEEYGKVGIKELDNGRRYRYYDVLKPARVPGEMTGWRKVREWKPDSGQKRTWMETLDGNGRIRQIRPETGGPKVHYRFDAAGNYTGKR